MGMDTNKIINQIWFELHGGDVIKSASKSIEDEFKQIKKYADEANASADKVIKKWTTLGQMSPQMSNISSAIYSKQESRRITNITRSTHATEYHPREDRDQIFNYSAARETWKIQEAEKKKQAVIEAQITKTIQNMSTFLEEGKKFQEQINDELKKQVDASKEKTRQMTDYQRGRLRNAAERNRINDKNASTRIREQEERERKNQELSGWNTFKSEHPEMYLTGAQNWNKFYQAARILSTIGNKLSSLGAGGRIIGDVFDVVGDFFKSPWAGIATAVTKVASAFIDLGKAATEAYANLEAIKTQLGVVFSSQTQANSTFKDISQYAIHSPFGIQQTSELAVLLKQSGVYASDLMDTLKMLGDTAGGNMEKMKRIANNYAQIVSIGKASMLDMRQFAYAGIPIFEAVSKELGVSQQQLRKLISDGKVTSDIIEKVFKDLTGINGIFEKATEKGAKTFKARLQNLKDAKQLALGSLGEFGVKIGTQSGGDSYAQRLLAWAENLYSYMEENVSTTNIEKDVDAIANREKRIIELEKLQQKYADNEKMMAILKKALDTETSKRSFDKDRATYEASYQAKVGMYQRNEDLIKNRETYEQYKALYEILAGKDALTWKGLKSERFDFFEGGFGIGNVLLAAQVHKVYKNFENMGFDLKAIEKLRPDERNEVIAVVKEAVKAIEGLTKVTEEEKKAHLETNLLNAQSLAYDQMQKSADATGSLSYWFQELTTIYRESDEYKQKEEEKRQKSLKEAKDILKKIEKNTSSEGVVDVSKYKGAKGLRELYDYMTKGAFTPGKKLSVVEGQSNADKDANRKELMSQIGTLAEAVRESFKGVAGAEGGLDAFSKGVIQKLTYMNPDTFYSKFYQYYNNMETALDGLVTIAGNTNKGLLEDTQMYKRLLPNLLNSWTFDYMGGDANLETGAGANTGFVAFWKRIFSSQTGLTTQMMASPDKVLKDYMDDVANRTITSGVMKAALTSMGVNAAVGLLKPTSDITQKRLQEGQGDIYQVDWRRTRESVKAFATQLSASTEVIKAYKEGLQSELDVLHNLIIQGSTEMETADLKEGQKLVALKTMGKIASNVQDSQLVNALGDKLKTFDDTGKALAVSIRDGMFIDENGNRVAEENLHIDDAIWDTIREYLPKLYTEMHEANAAELNNAALGKMISQATPTAFMSKIMESNADNFQRLKFLAGNEDYISQYVDSAISMYKNNDMYSKRYGQLSNADIVTKILSAESRYNTLLSQKDFFDKKGLDYNVFYPNFEDDLDEVLEDMHLLTIIFGGLNKNVDTLINTKDYRYASERLKYQKQDEALNSAVLRMMGVYTDDNAPFYKKLAPENYQGSRGTRNWLYRALGWNTDAFDKEDLFMKAVKSGFFKEDERFQTADKSDFFEGLSDDTILKFFDEADKRAVSLAYHFEEIAKSIDDMKVGLVQAMDTFAQGSLLAPMEQLGEWLVKDNDYLEGFQERMKQLGAEMLSQMGTYMARAGFSLVAMGAEQWNFGLIAGGLALAAAGGFASGLGGALKEGESAKDKSDKEAQRLENLKNDLQKLLEQARTDALYYENNLRHQTALGINKDFSYKSVHDAIITPRGVVETDPKDYLIATKTPQQFMGGGSVSVTPIINCNVVNNTNSRVRQEQTQNSDGSIDIITIIEDAVGDYIVSPRSDDAFQARQYRINGRQAIM